MASEQDEQSGQPPLSLHDARFSADREARPATWRLGAFLRAVAVYELLKGLTHWALLIGAGGSVEPLEGKSTAWFMAKAFFAVADPVAAVGLWVGAAWGVAIWLIAAIGQLIIAGVFGAGIVGAVLLVLTIALMAAYAVLSLQAAREAD